MFYFRQGSKLFFKNFILSVFLACQIATSVFLIGMTVSRYENITSNIEIFKSLSNVEGIYVMPAPELASNEEKLQEYIEKNSYGCNVSKIYNSFFSIENIDTELLFYDDLIINNCELPLKKGKWFSEACLNNSNIPIIINKERSNLKLGHTIDIYGMKCEIIGVLDTKGQYINYNIGGNKIDITALIENYDFSETMFICPYNRFSKEMLSDGFESTNFIVDLTDKNKDEIDYIRHNFNNIGFTQNLQDLYSTGIKNAQKSIINLLPYILISFLLSTVSVASSVSLILYKELDKYAKFYVCGISWEHFLNILPIYYAYLLFLAISISIIAKVFCINTDILSSYELTYTTKTLLTILLVIVTTFFAALLPITQIFKKHQPINILNKNFN